jgi:hypothetical protein
MLSTDDFVAALLSFSNQLKRVSLYFLSEKRGYRAMQLKRRVPWPRPAGRLMSSSLFDETSIAPRWWLLEPGQNPIGPINGELLLEWLRVGLVHPDALICEVGQQAWHAIGDPVELVATPQKRRSRFDPSKERCLLDIEPVPHDTVPPLSGEQPTAAGEARYESGPPPDEAGADAAEVTHVEVPRPLRVAASGTSRKS